MKETTISFGPQGSLIGTVVTPDLPNDQPGVLFLNAGFIPRIGPNRLFVRLARLLAKSGYPSLRFDFAGVGDSSRADRSSNEVAEIRLAMDELQKIAGSSTILLFGICSSTDHCLAIAPADSRVAGLFLIDPFAYANWRSDLIRRWRQVRHRLQQEIVSLRYQTRQHLQHGGLIRAVARKFLHLAKIKGKPVAEGPLEGSSVAEAIWNELRTKPSRREFAQYLTAALEKDQKVLIIYTSHVADDHNYRGQLQHVHPEVRRFRRIRTVLLPDADHTITRLHMQERLAGILMDWLEAK